MNKALLPLSILLALSVSAFASTNQIGSENALRGLSACASTDTVVLTQSITMTQSFSPLCPGGFKGVFDGNGKIISNLHITETAKFGAKVAFIALLDGGTLKDLTFQNPVIVVTKSNGNSPFEASVAVAVAELKSGSVENVHVHGGSVRVEGGTAAHVDAGGLAGTAGGGSISESDGDEIAITGTGATVNVGGICGNVTGDVTLTSVTYSGDAPVAGSVANNATLTSKYGAVTISQMGSNKSAVIDGEYDEADAINFTADISVNSVVLNRDFGGVPATITLPFEIDVANVVGAKFYNFDGMATKADGKKAVQMNRVKEGLLAANTPYGVRPEGNTISFTGPVTFKKTEEASVTVGEWKFVGLFAKYIVQPSDEGRLYGFAGESKDGISQGKFVRFLSGSSFKALRAYMLNIDEAPPTSPAPGLFKSASINSSIKGPSEVDVEWNDDGEGTTALRRSLNAPMIFKSNKNFDLKGRSVGEKSKAKGAYYSHGDLE